MLENIFSLTILMMESLVTLQQGDGIKTGLSAPRCWNQGPWVRTVRYTVNSGMDGQ